MPRNCEANFVAEKCSLAVPFTSEAFLFSGKTNQTHQPSAGMAEQVDDERKPVVIIAASYTTAVSALGLAIFNLDSRELRLTRASC